MDFSIESKYNDKVKRAKKISSSAKFRRETGEFFLEGMRLCRDAALSGTEILQFFYTEKAYENRKNEVEAIKKYAAVSYRISYEVATVLAETENNQGFFALCRMKNRENAPDIDTKGKYIALENIQDPANLGAVIRTAEALGIDGAVLCGCCDCYNPKAQRAAMGSMLRMNMIFTESLFDFLMECKRRGMKALAAVPDSAAKNITELDFSSGAVAVIGNEGNGVSDALLSICEKITIPMKGRAESLNASAAASIVMWEMMR